MNTKKEYLRELQKLLLWKYDAGEVVDILNDYREYFEIGAEKGKSEQDICEELGSPLSVVRTIQIETKKEDKKRIFFKNGIYSYKSWMRNISAAVFIIITIVFFLQIGNFEGYFSYSSSYISFILIFVPVFLPGVWLLLGGKLFSLDWTEKRDEPFAPKKLIFAHLFLAFEALIGISIFLKMLLDVEGFLNIVYKIIGNDPAYVGPFIHQIVQFIMLAALVVSIWALYQYRRYSMEYYSLFCHGMGVVYMSLAFQGILRTLDSFEKTWSRFYLNVIPYGEGVALAVLYLLYCKHVKRGKKDGCAV